MSTALQGADIITVHRPFNNSEIAIGVHIRDAIATFGHFPWCHVVSVVEDDLELSPGYTVPSVPSATYWWPTPREFECINDIGFFAGTMGSSESPASDPFDRARVCRVSQNV